MNKKDNFNELDFENFVNDCSDKIKCDDMACGEPWHCGHKDSIFSEFGDCSIKKCPKLKWLNE
jgi:FAD synthase